MKAFALNATVVLDSLWFLRNKITHEGARVDISGLIDTIKRRYADAEHSYAWGVVGRGSGLRWVPPVVGFLKLNSDVAIRPNGSYIAIVRDSSNSLCMAYIERLVAMDVLVGEASALAEAVALARRRKWLCVEMETDSLVLYKEVVCEAPPSWEIASLVEFIRLGLREFKEWKIAWVSRNCNRLAHRLAGWAARSNSVVFSRLWTFPSISGFVICMLLFDLVM